MAWQSYIEIFAGIKFSMPMPMLKIANLWKHPKGIVTDLAILNPLIFMQVQFMFNKSTRSWGMPLVDINKKDPVLSLGKSLCFRSSLPENIF